MANLLLIAITNVFVKQKQKKKKKIQFEIVAHILKIFDYELNELINKNCWQNITEIEISYLHERISFPITFKRACLLQGFRISRFHKNIAQYNWQKL